MERGGEPGAARVKAEPADQDAGPELGHERAPARAIHGVLKNEVQCLAGAGRIKVEAVKIEAVDSQEAVAVKQELYDDHEVQEELVLGPVSLQTRAPHSEIEVSVKLELEDEVRVKEEPGCESETAASAGSETEQTQPPDKRSWPTLTIGPIGDSWLAPRPGFVAPRPRAKRVKSKDIDSTTKKPTECDICHKQFKKAFRLKEHMRTHTGDKPYRCETCDKCFSQSSTLTKHERIHTGAKPYTCDICSKDFSLSESLTRHRRTHTGEKPYVCEICHEKFTNSGNLKEHKLIHTVGKPYSCGICKKDFARAGNLKVHERVHTGEKPYSCALCKKEFAQMSNFKKHKLIHKGGTSPV